MSISSIYQEIEEIIEGERRRKHLEIENLKKKLKSEGFRCSRIVKDEEYEAITLQYEKKWRDVTLPLLEKKIISRLTLLDKGNRKKLIEWTNMVKKFDDKESDDDVNIIKCIRKARKERKSIDKMKQKKVEEYKKKVEEYKKKVETKDACVGPDEASSYLLETKRNLFPIKSSTIPPSAFIDSSFALVTMYERGFTEYEKRIEQLVVAAVNRMNSLSKEDLNKAIRKYQESVEYDEIINKFRNIVDMIRNDERLQPVGEGKNRFMKSINFFLSLVVKDEDIPIPIDIRKNSLQINEKYLEDREKQEEYEKIFVEKAKESNRSIAVFIDKDFPVKFLEYSHKISRFNIYVDQDQIYWIVKKTVNAKTLEKIKQDKGIYSLFNLWSRIAKPIHAKRLDSSGSVLMIRIGSPFIKKICKKIYKDEDGKELLSFCGSINTLLYNIGYNTEYIFITSDGTLVFGSLLMSKRREKSSISATVLSEYMTGTYKKDLYSHRLIKLCSQSIFGRKFKSLIELKSILVIECRKFGMEKYMESFMDEVILFSDHHDRKIDVYGVEGYLIGSVKF